MLVGAFAFCVLLSTAEANPKNFVFAYLMVEDDPRYLKKRRYTGLPLRQRFPSLSGAKVAIRESRILSRSLGIKFKLVEKSIPSDGDYLSAINSLIKDGVKVFLMDVPIQILRAVTIKLRKEPVILFNIRTIFICISLRRLLHLPFQFLVHFLFFWSLVILVSGVIIFFLCYFGIEH